MGMCVTLPSYPAGIATAQGGSAGRKSQDALEGAGVLVKHLDGIVFNLGGVH